MSHCEVVKDQSRVEGEFAHFLGDITYAFAFDHAHGETPQTRHVLRPVAFTDAGAIFVEVPVEDVMARVFDAPMGAVGVEDLLGAGW
ncbi:MAG: hypothetical protein ACR2RB_22245 [Gammaproteobacteria bacterium]